MFTLSKIAKRKMHQSILDNQLRGVFVDLKKSGCNGYKYVLSYLHDVDPTWVEYPIDTVIKIYVSEANKEILTNTLIDYKADLFKEGFEFSNPKETSQCGCGESVNFDNTTLRL